MTIAKCAICKGGCCVCASSIGDTDYWDAHCTYCNNRVFQRGIIKSKKDAIIRWNDRQRWLKTILPNPPAKMLVDRIKYLEKLIK